MENQKSKIEQIKTLKAETDIQYLINEAYKIMGNPIVMYDLDYHAIVYTESNITDDLLWNEVVTTGCYSSETIEMFKDEGLIDIVASAKTITFLISDNLKYDRIFGKIYTKNEFTIGVIEAVARYKPFDDNDLELFEAFRERLSTEVCKMEFYRTYADVYQENLIKKLIDGNIEDRRLYALRIDAIYNGLKDYIYIAVVDLPKCGPDNTNLLYYKDLIKQVNPEFKCAVYSNYIVIVMSTDYTRPNEKGGLIKLQKALEHNNMYAGISSCFENLFILQKYYYEAIRALLYCINANNGQRIILFDDIKENFCKRQISRLKKI